MASPKYGSISHQDLVYANPFSVAKLEALLERLKLSPDAPALDIGAGNGEFAIRLVERYGAQVTAIDHADDFLTEASQRAAGRIPPEKLTLLQQDAAQFTAAPESFALISCIGATHAFGSYAATLRHLTPLLAPSGMLLVGELYWRQEPAPDYLEAFGVPRETYTSHAGNVAQGVALGLTPLDALVASHDDFDAYEWQRIWTLETYVRQHPDDPDGPELLRRIRAWRDLYLQWGRDTLGFGLYVFMR